MVTNLLGRRVVVGEGTANPESIRELVGYVVAVTASKHEFTLLVEDAKTGELFTVESYYCVVSPTPAP